MIPKKNFLQVHLNTCTVPPVISRPKKKRNISGLKVPLKSSYASSSLYEQLFLPLPFHEWAAFVSAWNINKYFAKYRQLTNLGTYPKVSSSQKRWLGQSHLQSFPPSHPTLEQRSRVNTRYKQLTNWGSYHKVSSSQKRWLGQPHLQSFPPSNPSLEQRSRVNTDNDTSFSSSACSCATVSSFAETNVSKCWTWDANRKANLSGLFK